MFYVCYIYVGYCIKYGKCNLVVLVLFRIDIIGKGKFWCMMNGKRLEIRYIYLVDWYYR